MKRNKALILGNEVPDDHYLWIEACERNDCIDYGVVNLLSANWFEEIQKHKFEILLAKPGGYSTAFKQLYDERIYILGKVMAYKVYPSPEEILVYENKRFLSFWLKANDIPHPETNVFYELEEAKQFIKKQKFPLIAKSNIGASGSGVVRLSNYEETLSYIHQGFSDKGVKRRWGPNFNSGRLLHRIFHYLLHPGKISKKINIYSRVKNEIQRGFVILQEYVPHTFEWRCVRIGDSFFAHKKMAIDDKASGLLIKQYENPPLNLLDFVKGLTDDFEFYSQAIDIFETQDGQYLVNEMQCIFGQSDPYQMLVDGKPGRYRYLEGKWIFEEGDFASNACYDLRLDYIIDHLLQHNH